MNPVISREYVEKNYIHKDKAKEVLEDIYDYFYRLNVPYEDIEFIEEKKKELLEETKDEKSSSNNNTYAMQEQKEQLTDINK